MMVIDNLLGRSSSGGSSNHNPRRQDLARTGWYGVAQIVGVHGHRYWLCKHVVAKLRHLGSRLTTIGSWIEGGKYHVASLSYH